MNNADWWANKLNGNTPPVTPVGRPQVPVGRPTNMPPMPPSQVPMAPMPQFQVPPSTRAQSASQTSNCPDCGSGNYMAIQNAAPRCFDCGYPLEQSGSRHGSLAGAHVEGGTKQASGNDTQNNWNPQGIIGRIEG
jgi:ribosomal protein S27AE